jgi:hypothetical protein
MRAHVGGGDAVVLGQHANAHEAEVLTAARLHGDLEVNVADGREGADAVAASLNNRPRKTLGFKTP